MIFNLEPNTSIPPLWWRLPSWTAITAVSVIETHGLGHRVIGAVLMVSAVITLQFIEASNVQVRAASLISTTVLGLVACFAVRHGLAEILVVVAASRAPKCLDGRALRAFTALDTVAFGATVGIISHSLPGVLAGLAIPLLVQRAIEQQTIIRERDRARALLTEVQAGREAEQQAAALRERGRIAREMHDVLAHSLAGLSVQLQGVRAIAAREGVSAAVMGPIDKAADLARDGLTEARSAMGALRDPVGLGVDDLPALVSRHPGRASITAVGDAGTVSTESGHAVYRAVQESLTNAARYAPGSAVVVSVTWQPGRLIVRVTDDGLPAGRSAVAGQGTGLGLAGMTERVTEAGGTVQAGPSAAGGWANRIEMPAS